MRRLALLAAIVVACLIAAAPAHAHLMNTGFGPFYDGLAHPLVTPEDLLPIVALTLLAGLNGARCGRWVLFTLPAAWLAGMVAGWVFLPNAGGGWWVAVLTIALGALVAADRKLPLPAVVSGAALLGLAHGALNGASLAPTGSSPSGMLGVAATIFVVAALLAGAVVSLKKPWTRVVVRVAGSWIAAIGLLMLGWSVRLAGR